MGDVIDIKIWEEMTAEHRFDKNLKDFLQMCKEITQLYTPKEYVIYLGKRIKQQLSRKKLDHEAMIIYLTLLDILKVAEEDFYLDMVCNKDFEKKIVTPLTNYISKYNYIWREHGKND